MKNYKEVPGIEGSKKKSGAYCYRGYAHRGFVNDILGYKSLLKWVLKETQENKVFN
jgi:hypothetical protein